VKPKKFLYIILKFCIYAPLLNSSPDPAPGIRDLPVSNSPLRQLPGFRRLICCFLQFHLDNWRRFKNESPLPVVAALTGRQPILKRFKFEIGRKIERLDYTSQLVRFSPKARWDYVIDLHTQ